MQLSYNGIKFLQDEEGFRAKAYLDGGGVPTIGYGTTVINGKPVEMGMTCTQQEAELWMQAHLAKVQTCVNQGVRVPLKQDQFDMLCSFVYNLGENAFLKSTLLCKLNTGDYVGAGAQFDRWVYDNGKVVNGLVGRRRRERSNFDK